MATSVQKPRQRRTSAQKDPSSARISTPASSTQAYQRSPHPDEVASLTKFNVLPITSAGHVLYLGESAGFDLLLRGSQSPVHFPMPQDTLALSVPAGLDPLEIQILKRRGAFVLPPKALCDDLIETFFSWVHPIVPVINRTKFMSQYRDARNPPSMLLLQCILLAGARISTNPQLKVDGSTSTAVATFYRRAKALYDAEYERDRITLVQSMLLMGWYWAGPDDISKNMFYWSQSAITVAQNFGLHRTMESSRLSISEKRLRRRIWWTLFTRDRALAVALGQSISINLDDCDIDMIAEDDFIEHDGNDIDEYPPDPIHVEFFVQHGQDCNDINSISAALSKWNQECPITMRWERSKHHFWSGILYLHYFSARCLLHRASSPRNRKTLQDTKQSYGSPDGTVRAANMITSIIEALSDKQQLRRCPPFIVHSLFSAIVIHLHVSNTPSPSISRLAHRRLSTCLEAIKDLAQVWVVGKTVLTMIEKISGLSREEKPSRHGNGSALKGEVFIDLGCADASGPAYSPSNGNPLTEAKDNTQTPQDLPNCDETLPYYEAHPPVVIGFPEGHHNVHDNPPPPDLGDPQPKIGYSSLLPDGTFLSGFVPDTFYVENTAQICNAMTDMTALTWDQFQIGCQQDYSISVPWSLELDFQGLIPPTIVYFFPASGYALLSSGFYHPTIFDFYSTHSALTILFEYLQQPFEMAAVRDVDILTYDGLKLKGTFYSVRTNKPCIVMSHGFSGHRDHFLPELAAKFNEAGYGAMVYDNRCWGDSEGLPRCEADPVKQTRDYLDVFNFAAALPEVDPTKIVYWGSSLSGGNAICAAAMNKSLAGIISQVPFVSGGSMARITGAPKSLLVSRRTPNSEIQIPIYPNSVEEVQDGTTKAILKDAGAVEFAEEMTRRGYSYDKTATLQSLTNTIMHEPTGVIHHISPTPLLMIVADDDVCTYTHLQLEAFEKALQPKTLMIVKGTGHFDLYYGKRFQEVVGMQLEFLRSIF
ncbi:cutinase transcription factor 1 alpha [Fusarium circinatum]|uniref:Cutinase transcription factor 1 alpha n=1 Tax=Fusarium circinatum TaxID=48490 RepID=A0A8H5WYF6_FUSCI|nr:cutinase transcription factor 1 alpha [Fusarium circinatum]